MTKLIVTLSLAFTTVTSNAEIVSGSADILPLELEETEPNFEQLISNIESFIEEHCSDEVVTNEELCAKARTELRDLENSQY